MIRGGPEGLEDTAYWPVSVAPQDEVFGRTDPSKPHPKAVLGLWPMRPQWGGKAGPGLGILKWSGGWFG